ETKSKHHQHYRDRDRVDRDRERDKTRDRDRDRQSGRRREDRREDRKHHRHADEVEKHKKIETQTEVLQQQQAVRPPGASIEERRRVKALLKAAETPEQKRGPSVRNDGVGELGWEGDYTDRDNPFGDEKLTQTFVWHKKLQREGGTMADVERKAAENRAELEKVRERCRQNELEREARLKEQEQEQRDRESENFRQWWQQEDAFHLKQARARSAIRIAEGRAKPIDLLGRYAEALQRISGIKIKRDDGADDNDDEFDEDESLAFLDAHSPDALLTGLSVDDLEDLKVDIGVYQKLERQSGLTEGACRDSETFWSCVALLVQHALDSKTAPAASSATAAVADRIDAVIRGKSASQLAALEDSVSARICAAGPGTDLAYWEEMLDKVKVAKGKATLQELHKVLLRRRMQRLQERQSADQGAEVDDPEVAAASAEPEEKTEEIAVKTPGLAAWSDRLKPKKPRYFNRVNTGYNWGAYNRTHFDSDNPPPKIVQGYKFNIFYPDLLDKSKAPSYSTSRAKTIRNLPSALHCWPPYEDVAFKIVRNEWDTSFRHGFRCQFVNNTFQLHFHFRRNRLQK
uniref:Splicing factor Cactin n=1 Tax=Macrostomum lignano TaxID=282301 RepID=A0A1I8IZ60_9PLAT